MLERHNVQPNTDNNNFDTVDPAAFNISSEEIESVSVPEIPSNICSNLHIKLCDFQSSIETETDFGRELYTRCIAECGLYLLGNCLECFQ